MKRRILSAMLTIALCFNYATCYAEDGFLLEQSEVELISSEDISSENSIINEDAIEKETEEIGCLKTAELTIATEQDNTDDETEDVYSSEGSIGEQVSYKYVQNDDGSLKFVVYGNGAMPDYSEKDIPPWGISVDNPVTEIEIQDGVTSIGSYSFKNFDHLTKVSLPDTLQHIGFAAFYGCGALTNITVPGSVKNIDYGAFYYAAGLKNVVLSEGITSIGDYGFWGCYDLETITIPSTLTSIGEHVFEGASYSYPVNFVYGGTKEEWNLISIAGNTDFVGKVECTDGIIGGDDSEDLPIVEEGMCGDNLTYTVRGSSASGYKLQVSGTGPMSDDQPWKKYRFQIKEVLLPEGITTIGNYAFQYFQKLTDITIPESVTSIGRYAFQNCFLLSNLIIPERVTSISPYAFQNCQAFRNIIIPDGVTSIGKYAFYNCVELNSITIPKTLKNVDEYAFCANRNLKEVNYDGSPEEWEQIVIAKENDDLRFAYYSSNEVTPPLQEYSGTLGSNVSYTCIGNDYNGYKLTISGHGTIEDFPYTTEDSPLNAFRIYTTEIKIEKGITGIGEGNFAYFFNLTNVYIPEGVTTIADKAFTSCYKLNTIFIPRSLESIGYYGIQSYGSLKNVYYGGTKTEWNTISMDDGNEELKSTKVNRFFDCGCDITEHPEVVYTQPDSSVTWKVVANGYNLSYQWQYKNGKSWTDFAGANTDTLTKKVPASWDGWYVRCLVSDQFGNEIQSNAARINIVNDIIITEQPENVVTAPDASVLWSAIAEGNSLSYQWQYKNGNTWSNFGGETAASMTKKVPASWDGWQIRCQIKDVNGTVTYTTVSKIEINSAIVISQQPESITVGPATTNTWVVKATGEGLTYQWQYKEKNKNTWNNFKDATSAVLTKTIPENWDQWSVRCVITDQNGNSIYSKIVKIDINTDIVIESQPEDVLAEAGTNVTWEVEATSEGLTYQWQYKTGNNWNNFAGASEAAMTKKVQESWNGWPIRCRISDVNGNVIYTRTVTLKIGTAIVISEQPEDMIARAGDSVTWSVKATGDNLTYQWQYKNGKNWSKFSGATETSLTKKVPETWDGWQIRCMLTDAEGNQSFTNAVTLYIGTPIIISQQPQDVTVSAGQAATWSIKATGDNLTYQWQYKNGKNWNNFSGATGTSMTKNVPFSWNGWQVRCQITDGEGHVIYSKTANIIVQ